jgi:hypothetical protein
MGVAGPMLEPAAGLVASTGELDGGN